MRLLRSVIGVILGVVFGSAVIAVVEQIISRAYPLPDDTDFTNLESVRAAMESQPAMAMAMVLLGWFLGALVGAATAVLIAGRRPVLHGMIVAGLILCAAVVNLVLLPHPIWMWPGALVLIPLGGWAGATTGRLVGTGGRDPSD